MAKFLLPKPETADRVNTSSALEDRPGEVLVSIYEAGCRNVSRNPRFAAGARPAACRGTQYPYPGYFAKEAGIYWLGANWDSAACSSCLRLKLALNPDPSKPKGRPPALRRRVLLESLQTVIWIAKMTESFS